MPSTTGAPPTGAAPPPTNYRPAVAAQIKSTFFDPYSIRDASISRPLYATAVHDGTNITPMSGWIVCVKANAKNRMGGYTGQEFSAFLFSGENIKTSLSGPEFSLQLDMHCKPAVMEPFPEIEMLG